MSFFFVNVLSNCFCLGNMFVLNNINVNFFYAFFPENHRKIKGSVCCTLSLQYILYVKLFLSKNCCIIEATTNHQLVLLFTPNSAVAAAKNLKHNTSSVVGQRFGYQKSEKQNRKYKGYLSLSKILTKYCYCL